MFGRVYGWVHFACMAESVSRVWLSCFRVYSRVPIRVYGWVTFRVYGWGPDPKNTVLYIQYIYIYVYIHMYRYICIDIQYIYIYAHISTFDIFWLEAQLKMPQIFCVFCIIISTNVLAICGGKFVAYNPIHGAYEWGVRTWTNDGTLKTIRCSSTSIRARER